MVKSRIIERFNLLRKQGRPGLVTFITAGDPNLKISASILGKLPEAGADIIELGIPFSDPMADGPIIQAASQRALTSGTNLGAVISMVDKFRKSDKHTPLILMGYYNPIFIYGVERFIIEAETAGVDGIIVVDLPLEESEMRVALKKSAIQFIYMIAPTTNGERLTKIASSAGGFIYYVSVSGITGTKEVPTEEVADALKTIRRHTDIPVAVGFGIKTPEQAAKIGRYADAAVVGSALVSCISENLAPDGKPEQSCEDTLLSLVGSLANGLQSTSVKD